jgi:transposase InsO family protein
VTVKYACIAAHRAQYPIALMCRVLGISRAAYYAAQQRAPSARALQDRALVTRIHVLHQASRRTYGAPRIRAALLAQGEAVSRKRVARLIRAERLRGVVPRRWRATAASDPRATTPNRLARAFAPSPQLNRAWVADITYLPYRGGTAYLAVVLDVASRAVVGWALEPHLQTTLPLAALQQALLTRRPATGALHHSDRGVQYQSGAYEAMLAHHGLVRSLSAIGNCYDNAVVESFFSTLKRECPTTERSSIMELRSVLFDYIKIWYNRARLHSSLGYRAPFVYEAQLMTRERAA